MNEIRTIRLDGGFDRWDELLRLVVSSFAYMNDRIDPPSSAASLTLQALQEKATTEIGFAVVEEKSIVGCVFCRPEPDCLYIGKLAVLPDNQGKGVGRKLLMLAEETARLLDLPTLRLETRIELVGNHATFSRWGFVRTAAKSHPGFTHVTFIEMRKAIA